MLLLDQRVIFLLTCVYLSIPQNFVPGILLLDRLNLPLIHVVVYGHLFLLKINIHLGNLLFCGHLLIPLPLLSHLEDLHLVNVIIVVEVVFGSVDSIRFVLDECHSSAHNFVIPVFVQLGSFLPYALYSFDETVVVSVGVVCYNAHAAVDLDDLLPVR